MQAPQSRMYQKSFANKLRNPSSTHTSPHHAGLLQSTDGFTRPAREYIDFYTATNQEAFAVNGASAPLKSRVGSAQLLHIDDPLPDELNRDSPLSYLQQQLEDARKEKRNSQYYKMLAGTNESQFSNQFIVGKRIQSDMAVASHAAPTLTSRETPIPTERKLPSIDSQAIAHARTAVSSGPMSGSKRKKQETRAPLKKSNTELRDKPSPGVALFKKRNMLQGELGVIDERIAERKKGSIIMAQANYDSKLGGGGGGNKLNSNKKQAQLSNKRPQSSQIKNCKNSTRNTFQKVTKPQKAVSVRTSDKKTAARFLRKGSGSEYQQEVSQATTTATTLTHSPSKLHFSHSAADIMRGRSPQQMERFYPEQEKSRASQSDGDDFRQLSVSSADSAAGEFKLKGITGRRVRKPSEVSNHDSFGKQSDYDYIPHEKAQDTARSSSSFRRKTSLHQGGSGGGASGSAQMLGQMNRKSSANSLFIATARPVTSRPEKQLFDFQATMAPSTPQKYEDTRRLHFNRKRSRKSKPLLLVLFRGVLGEVIPPTGSGPPATSSNATNNNSNNLLNPYNNTFYTKDTSLNISAQSAVYKNNASLASTVIISDNSDFPRKRGVGSQDRNYLSVGPRNQERQLSSLSAILPVPSSIDEIQAREMDLKVSVALRPGLQTGLAMLQRHFQTVLVMNTARRVSRAVLESIKSTLDRGLNCFDAVYIFKEKEPSPTCERPFYFNPDEFSSFKQLSLDFDLEQAQGTGGVALLNSLNMDGYDLLNVLSDSSFSQQCILSDRISNISKFPLLRDISNQPLTVQPLTILVPHCLTGLSKASLNTSSVMTAREVSGSFKLNFVALVQEIEALMQQRQQAMHVRVSESESPQRERLETSSPEHKRAGSTSMKHIQIFGCAGEVEGAVAGAENIGAEESVEGGFNFQRLFENVEGGRAVETEKVFGEFAKEQALVQQLRAGRAEVRRRFARLAETLSGNSVEQRIERVKKIANLMMSKRNFSPAMMLMIERNFREMSRRIQELEAMTKRHESEAEASEAWGSADPWRRITHRFVLTGVEQLVAQVQQLEGLQL